MANPATMVAGNCNGAAGVGNQTLNGPIDIVLSSDATLYVADWNNDRVQAFASGSSIGTTFVSSIGSPQGLFIDSHSNIYVTAGSSKKVMVYPAGLSVPSVTSSTCNWPISLNDAYGIAVDSSGNMYVTSSSCHFITRWNITSANATLLIASSSLVNQPRHMYLDEDNSALYVADTLNHRILTIFLNGNLTAQTVAGIQGVPGNTADKLNSPAGVYMSGNDGAIYVADTLNHRVQKWAVGASSGITVAGNPAGIAGSNMYDLNKPYAVILDRTETFLYVADYNNNRVQQFILP
jgi:DNA-binding beta-propeller fold protein YncE